MAVSPVTRRGPAVAIGVLVATIGLVVGAGFLAVTTPASAPPEAHDVGRQGLLAVVVATGSIGTFLIWRAPRNRGGVLTIRSSANGTRLIGSLP